MTYESAVVIQKEWFEIIARSIAGNERFNFADRQIGQNWAVLQAEMREDPSL